LAPANNPDEQIPCASIILTPPSTHHIFIKNRHTIIIDICTTEEYAITTFISLFKIHIMPKILPPIKLILINKYINILFPDKNQTRIKPYPPNFNSTPAKIIDPDTGASTCAFGSHKWTEYIGNFTKKS